jgi:hypothetical protein
MDTVEAGLKATQRVRELEAIVAAKDMEIAGLELAIADRDHRIKALLFEISARAKSAEVYTRDEGF